MIFEGKTLYACYDPFPSPKGSGTHMAEVIKTLFGQSSQKGLLLVPGKVNQPGRQVEKEGEIRRFFSPSKNHLQRALQFGEWVGEVAGGVEKFQLAQFRDPWGGLALIQLDPRPKRLIFEVNGLPSMELPFLYPGIFPSTLKKIHHMEQICLEKADKILVPGQVILEYLQNRGIPPEKICLIPNGSQIPPLTKKPPSGISIPYAIYTGGHQPWQGVTVLLRAFTQMVHAIPHQLVLALSHPPKKWKGLKKLARRLGLEGRVTFLHSLPQKKVFSLLQWADFSVAPLTACSRNVVQGCCPLKIIESLACATPVLASRLKVVEEFIEDGVEGILVPPENPEALGLGMIKILKNGTKWVKMGESARDKIQKNFTWEQSNLKLAEFYRQTQLGS